MKKKIILFFLILSLNLEAQDFFELKALYNSLDPTSISQWLAFYHLYPETKEGKEALKKAFALLTKYQDKKISIEELDLNAFALSQEFLPAILGLINRNKLTSYQLAAAELDLIDQLGSCLCNRKLKGYRAKTENEVFTLPSEEIDLGRALLLSQLDETPDSIKQIRIYEAMLDLMSLQVIARLPENPTPEEKIEAINQFIFEEMHFRFPPQSEYAKDIDLYTFLPSVLDQHLGVCLGVTTLYISIAQRIDLPLEIITPPGHIYVRYKKGNKEINIETTARGVDHPTETYLGVNTYALEKRTLKEVIGMTHINQASIYLHNRNYDKAVRSYEKASPYMHDDPLLTELLGYSYLLNGNQEKGSSLLNQASKMNSFGIITRHQNCVEDYLEGKVDVEGIEATLMSVDNDRESILKKLQALQKTLQKFPTFRSGLQQCAVAWLQLNRSKEALEILMRYHEIDPSDPTVEYYLAVLHAERLDFKKAWVHLKQAEKITAQFDFKPKALKELHLELQKNCPDL